jgi:hypothetical protein
MMPPVSPNPLVSNRYNGSILDAEAWLIRQAGRVIMLDPSAIMNQPSSFIQARRVAMNNKTIGTVLLVAGVILLLASLTADVIGIGEAPDAFGIRQIAGVVVGVIAAVAGFVMRSRV